MVAPSWMAITARASSPAVRKDAGRAERSIARLTSNVPADAVYVAPIELVIRSSTAPPLRAAE